MPEEAEVVAEVLGRHLCPPSKNKDGKGCYTCEDANCGHYKGGK